jgi:undecaprenyl-diphosphatase
MGRMTSLMSRWAGGAKHDEETFVAKPACALGWGSGLLALVVVAAVLIPAGPLDIDSRWAELMQDIQAPWLRQVALIFNALGRGWSLVTIGAIGLLLVVGRRWVALVAFACTEAVTPLLVAVIKALVDRPRPVDELIHPHGSSFPSGHAAYAAATTTALVLLFTKSDRDRRAWVPPAVLLTAGMSWSRTYLQVHWLSDVAAGATLGLAVALIAFATIQIITVRRTVNRGIPVR